MVHGLGQFWVWLNIIFSDYLLFIKLYTSHVDDSVNYIGYFITFTLFFHLKRQLIRVKGLHYKLASSWSSQSTNNDQKKMLKYSCGEQYKCATRDWESSTRKNTKIGWAFPLLVVQHPKGRQNDHGSGDEKEYINREDEAGDTCDSKSELEPESLNGNLVAPCKTEPRRLQSQGKNSDA